MRRPERRDGVALVPGYGSRFLGVGQRHPTNAEQGAQLGPIETTPGRDEHEQVVPFATPNHDRAQQLPRLDALEARALLG
jgi:hypothetical protein